VYDLSFKGHQVIEDEVDCVCTNYENF